MISRTRRIDIKIVSKTFAIATPDRAGVHLLTTVGLIPKICRLRSLEDYFIDTWWHLIEQVHLLLTPVMDSTGYMLIPAKIKTISMKTSGI